MTDTTLSSKARHFALIPAAGIGARMGTATPKQYMPIAGKPMMLHVLDTFAATEDITHTFVVVSADDGYIDDLVQTVPHLAGKLTVLRCGGATRADTVNNGLSAIRHIAQDNDWILVHDAARPGITSMLINTLMHTLADDVTGGLLALPVVDTLKHATEGRADKTVPRAHLWAAQTPQMFRYALLSRALHQAQDHLGELTDDASAIEMMGFAPKLVEGSPRNFKVTLPHDVVLAEFLLLQTKG
jgi:2-C-methyl-D-erythritol 4-phosphate cytidylyltransferase